MFSNREWILLTYVTLKNNNAPERICAEPSNGPLAMRHPRFDLVSQIFG